MIILHCTNTQEAIIPNNNTNATDDVSDNALVNSLKNLIFNIIADVVASNNSGEKMTDVCERLLEAIRTGLQMHLNEKIDDTVRQPGKHSSLQHIAEIIVDIIKAITPLHVALVVNTWLMDQVLNDNELVQGFKTLMPDVNKYYSEAQLVQAIMRGFISISTLPIEDINDKMSENIQGQSLAPVNKLSVTKKEIDEVMNDMESWLLRKFPKKCIKALIYSQEKLESLYAAKKYVKNIQQANLSALNNLNDQIAQFFQHFNLCDLKNDKKSLSTQYVLQMLKVMQTLLQTDSVAAILLQTMQNIHILKSIGNCISTYWCRHDKEFMQAVHIIKFNNTIEVLQEAAKSRKKNSIAVMPIIHALLKDFAFALSIPQQSNQQTPSGLAELITNGLEVLKQLNDSKNHVAFNNAVQVFTGLFGGQRETTKYTLYVPTTELMSMGINLLRLMGCKAEDEAAQIANCAEIFYKEYLNQLPKMYSSIVEYLEGQCKHIDKNHNNMSSILNTTVNLIPLGKLSVFILYFKKLADMPKDPNLIHTPLRELNQFNIFGTLDTLSAVHQHSFPDSLSNLTAWISCVYAWYSHEAAQTEELLELITQTKGSFTQATITHICQFLHQTGPEIKKLIDQILLAMRKHNIPLNVFSNIQNIKIKITKMECNTPDLHLYTAALESLYSKLHLCLTLYCGQVALAGLELFLTEYKTTKNTLRGTLKAIQYILRRLQPNVTRYDMSENYSIDKLIPKLCHVLEHSTTPAHIKFLSKVVKTLGHMSPKHQPDDRKKQSEDEKLVSNAIIAATKLGLASTGITLQQPWFLHTAIEFDIDNLHGSKVVHDIKTVQVHASQSDETRLLTRVMEWMCFTYLWYNVEFINTSIPFQLMYFTIMTIYGMYLVNQQLLARGENAIHGTVSRTVYVLSSTKVLFYATMAFMCLLATVATYYMLHLALPHAAHVASELLSVAKKAIDTAIMLPKVFIGHNADVSEIDACVQYLTTMYNQCSNPNKLQSVVQHFCADAAIKCMYQNSTGWACDITESVQPLFRNIQENLNTICLAQENKSITAVMSTTYAHGLYWFMYCFIMFMAVLKHLNNFRGLKRWIKDKILKQRNDIGLNNEVSPNQSINDIGEFATLIFFLQQVAKGYGFVYFSQIAIATVLLDLAITYDPTGMIQQCSTKLLALYNKLIQKTVSVHNRVVLSAENLFNNTENPQRMIPVLLTISMMLVRAVDVTFYSNILYSGSAIGYVAWNVYQQMEHGSNLNFYNKFMMGIRNLLGSANNNEAFNINDLNIPIQTWWLLALTTQCFNYPTVLSDVIYTDSALLWTTAMQTIPMIIALCYGQSEVTKDISYIAKWCVKYFQKNWNHIPLKILAKVIAVSAGLGIAGVSMLIWNTAFAMDAIKVMYSGTLLTGAALLHNYIENTIDAAKNIQQPVDRMWKKHLGKILPVVAATIALYTEDNMHKYYPIQNNFKHFVCSILEISIRCSLAMAASWVSLQTLNEYPIAGKPIERLLKMLCNRLVTTDPILTANIEILYNILKTYGSISIPQPIAIQSQIPNANSTLPVPATSSNQPANSILTAPQQAQTAPAANSYPSFTGTNISFVDYETRQKAIETLKDKITEKNTVSKNSQIAPVGVDTYIQYSLAKKPENIYSATKSTAMIFDNSDSNTPSNTLDHSAQSVMLFVVCGGTVCGAALVYVLKSFHNAKLEITEQLPEDTLEVQEQYIDCQHYPGTEVI